MIKREIPVEFFIKPPNPKQPVQSNGNGPKSNPNQTANNRQFQQQQKVPVLPPPANNYGKTATGTAGTYNQASVNNFMSYRNSHLSTSSSLPSSDNSGGSQNKNNYGANNYNSNFVASNNSSNQNAVSRNGSLDSGSISIASYTSESSEADNLNNYNFHRNYNLAAANDNKTGGGAVNAVNTTNANKNNNNMNMAKNKTYVLNANGGLGNDQIQLSPVLDDLDDDLHDFGARSIRAARLNFPPSTTTTNKLNYAYNQPPVLSGSFLSKEAEQIKKRLDEYVDSASRVLNDINTKTYKRQSEELFNTKFLDEFETTPKYTPSLFRRSEQPKERLAEMFIGRMKEEAYQEVPFRNYEDVPVRRIRPRLQYFEPGVTDSPNYKPPQSPNNSLFINQQRYFYENK